MNFKQALKHIYSTYPEVTHMRFKMSLVRGIVWALIVFAGATWLVNSEQDTASINWVIYSFAIISPIVSVAIAISNPFLMNTDNFQKLVNTWDAIVCYFSRPWFIPYTFVLTVNHVYAAYVLFDKNYPTSALLYLLGTVLIPTLYIYPTLYMKFFEAYHSAENAEYRAQLDKEAEDLLPKTPTEPVDL